MIIVGARDSKLSRLQTGQVITALRAQSVMIQAKYLKSKGDLNHSTPVHLMNEDGVFTSFLEQAILEGEVDLVVHSLKDLPTTVPENLDVIPVLPREDPRDVMIVHKDQLRFNESQQTPGIPLLKSGTRIATSSLRRQAQVQQLFPNSMILDLRGNIDTRLRKLKENWFDALVLSQAGLNRYALHVPTEYIAFQLPLQQFPTAPGQGSLAIQFKKGNEEIRALVMKLVHEPSKEKVEFERFLLQRLGSGCMIPVGITVFQENEWYFLSYFNGQRKNSNTRLLLGHSSLHELKQMAIGEIRFQDKGDENGNDVKNLETTSLLNQHVIITKSEEDKIVQELLEQGIKVYSLPQHVYGPATVNIDRLKQAVEQSDWVIFTSKRGAWYYPKQLYQTLLQKRIGVIGGTTAQQVRKQGLPVHYIARENTGADLAREILRLEPGVKAVTHLTSMSPSQGLRDVFEEQGVRVYQYGVYQAQELEVQGSVLPVSHKETWVIVTSPKQATRLLTSQKLSENVKWISIGPRTTMALKERGITSVLTLTSPTATKIMEVLINE